MNSILFPLTAVLSLAFAVLIVRYSVRFLVRPAERIMSVILVCAVCILSVLLSLAFKALPGKTEDLIGQSTGVLESRLEEEYPGCLTRELDSQKLEDLIEDSRQIRGDVMSFAGDYGFLAKMIGVNTYMSVFGSLIDGAENNMEAMQADGKMFTLENVIDHLQERANARISSISVTAMWIVLAVTAVLYAALFLMCVAFRKGWTSTSGSSVVFGDGVDADADADADAK